MSYGPKIPMFVGFGNPLNSIFAKSSLTYQKKLKLLILNPIEKEEYIINLFFHRQHWYNRNMILSASQHFSSILGSCLQTHKNILRFVSGSIFWILFLAEFPLNDKSFQYSTESLTVGQWCHLLRGHNRCHSEGLSNRVSPKLRTAAAVAPAQELIYLPVLL